MKALFVIALVVVVVGGAHLAQKASEQTTVAEHATPAVIVTATRLAKDYSENEVEADRLYRDKLLRVNGVVDAVKKDITDDPYIVLKTKNQFAGVHAYFDNDNDLAGLRRGHEIWVRCLGDNVILGSPMLRRCIVE